MVFCFVQNFFFGQHESQNIYFFYRSKPEFFFQNLTLGYMTKTLNQIIFFPPPKSKYFFQQHWESEYFFFFFFRKKNKPPQVKWSFPYKSQRCICFICDIIYVVIPSQVISNSDTQVFSHSILIKFLLCNPVHLWFICIAIKYRYIFISMLYKKRYIKRI